MNTKEIEQVLARLGTVEDVSPEIIDPYKDDAPHSYLLFEDKYNDTTDDSLCIEVHTVGSYVVTNADLPYDCYSKRDTEALEELFKDTPFNLVVKQPNPNKYYVTVSVTAKANQLDPVVCLIELYRKCNDQFLADKVKVIRGDDGQFYLDRIDE